MTVPESESVFTVRTVEQARLLLDLSHGARLLEQFLSPATPSDAAGRLGEPANRVTYHVHKHVAAGLLRRVDGPGKRARYEAVAREFRVPKRFVPAQDPLALLEPIMRDLAHGLARAHVNAYDAASGDETAAVLHLGPAPHARSALGPDGPYGAQFRLHGRKFSPARYAELQTALAETLARFETPEEGGDTHDPDAHDCVVALVMYRGRLHEDEA